MDLLMGIATLLGIVAVVAVVAGIIAFAGFMIIGAFDKDKSATKANNEVLDYSQYKQLEDSHENTHEFDFEAINDAKVEQEKKLADKDEDDAFKLLEDEDDVNPEEMEKKLVEEKEKQAQPAAPKAADNSDEDEDLDLDNLLDEISNDVEEEVKAENNEEVKASDELESYSIDDILNQAQEETSEEAEEPKPEVVEEPESDEAEEEPEQEEAETTSTEEETEVATQVVDEQSQKEIEALRAQVAELNKKLSEASTKTNVVTIDMTEEECLARLAVLEERLKTAKKDYRINQKEYRPLKKIMNELERNQVKLRRKDAVVAKQKVALYGVNNYVDIDKEKAEKLANELELLDGLRLSVQHCEEVIAANKDRYPILEHTNAILEEQIANLEADIESTKLTLEKIREKEGKGGNK